MSKVVEMMKMWASMNPCERQEFEMHRDALSELLRKDGFMPSSHPDKRGFNRVVREYVESLGE